MLLLRVHHLLLLLHLLLLHRLPQLLRLRQQLLRLLQRLLRQLLRQRRAHLLGSDCHNMKERKPNLGAAAERITRKLGKDTMDWIYDKERSILR